MDKLYTHSRWLERCGRFMHIDTSQAPPHEPKIVTVTAGRTIVYDYYATAESTSTHYYKRIYRVVLGWLLHVGTLGHAGCHPTVRAWMQGRRADRIYIVRPNDSSPLVPIPEPVSRSAHDAPISKTSRQQFVVKDPTPLTPPKKLSELKCCNVLTKGVISKLWAESRRPVSVLQILLFAEDNQPILPILEEYLQDKSSSDEATVRACIKVLEQSLCVSFGKNEHDDEKIIIAFMEKLLRRAYHGTSKANATLLLQNGISYEKAANGYDYDELNKLFDECRLSLSTYYERHRGSEREDLRCFYVARLASTGWHYARNNGPEWFLPFRRCGTGSGGEFDREQFRRKLLEISPRCTDVARVSRFAESHWARCATNKKNAAIVIVELSETDTMRTLHQRLKGKQSDDLHSLLLEYFHSLANRCGVHVPIIPWFAKDDLSLNEQIAPLRAASIVRVLSHPLAKEMALDERLGPDNTTEPPKVIQAIKIGAT